MEIPNTSVACEMGATTVEAQESQICMTYQKILVDMPQKT